MDIVFRKLPPVETLTPQPGEIYLVPRADVPPGSSPSSSAAERHRRALANYVLQHGEAGLAKWNGPLDRMVVDIDPKLDDMLAATILQAQRAGQLLPQGLEDFCRYAAQLRDGVRPASTPLEHSVEGLFLAMRSRAERRLSDRETATRFLGDWQRLAEAIMVAATQQLSPYFHPLLGFTSSGGTSVPLKSVFQSPAAAMQSDLGGHDFSEEVALLEKDRDLYAEDLSHAERGFLRMAKKKEPIAALLLRQPKSAFLKYWTRSQGPSPMEGPFPFLGIQTGPGQWVFSIDPSRGVSLKPLVDQLDAAEKAGKSAATGPECAWYDGASLGHTQIASPRGGSKLSDDRVLSIVKKWGGFDSAAGPKSLSGRDGLGRVAKGMIGASVVVVIMAAFFAWRSFGGATNGGPGGDMAEIHDVYVLTVGVSDYKNLPALPNAATDADALAAAFKDQQGRLCPIVATKTLKNADASRANIIDYALRQWLLVQQPTTRRSLAVITFSGHGFLEPGTNRYHFAPQDYDPENQGSTGIYLADLQRYLATLPCPSVVMFDTCHSGATDDTEDKNSRPDTLIATMQKALLEGRDSKGLVVMAACGRYQKANETSRWGHGALTLAVLEGMSGRPLYEGKTLFKTPLPKAGPAGVITLRDLDTYVAERVEALASEISNVKYRGQVAKTFALGNIALDRVPIAVRK